MWRRRFIPWAATVALVAMSVAPVWAGAPQANVRRARLQSNVKLANPIHHLTQDSTLTCFEGFLTDIISPACFTIDQPADCIATSDQFLVQYLFPTFQSEYQITGFGFLSNDGDTTFPSAGVLLLPIDNQGFVRFPTANELANLQATNVDTQADTSVVFVDLTETNLLIGPADDVAIVVALQFPDGGELVDVAVGPGIAADGLEPDQDCDFFTVDGGASGVWYAPFYDPVNFPDIPPLDWGFVVIVEPPVAVLQKSWTQVKTLYRTP